MCGIAACFAYSSAVPPVDEAELLRMRDQMTARGPDGTGLWFSDDRRVGLAHRRLSIIDLSAAGAQPMSSEDGRLVIVFNGEIYNHRALRAGLEARGRRFRSNSDTEVLLHLYAERGREMLGDLRGMFAFALWDADRQGLLLARDTFGIKPLYVADDGKTLRVASQVKSLLAAGGVDTSPDPAGQVGFFCGAMCRSRIRCIAASGHCQRAAGCGRARMARGSPEPTAASGKSSACPPLATRSHRRRAPCGPRLSTRCVTI